MMCSGHTYNTCSIDAVEIRAVFAWRHNAIGSEKEYTVEFFKLIGLFPPCVAIVARKMRVFLECRIILTRKHLGMGIDIDAFPSCLLKQFFKVFEVVSADKDARIVADTYIDLSYFGITVGSGIRAVKEFHRLHSSFADIQHERKQFIDTDIPTGCLGQCILDYGIHIVILITEIGGMAGVCCHTFTTINGKLFESAYILVGVCQHSGDGSVFLGFIGSGIKLYDRKVRQLDTLLLGSAGEKILDLESASDEIVKRCVIEIRVGNSCEQGIYHQMACLPRRLVFLTKGAVDCRYSADAI